MNIEHVEVLVEEPSMEAALRVLLPGVLGRTSFQVYQHQCKSELLKRLPDRLRGYAAWLPANWRILVVVDLDEDHCVRLKTRLESIASRAGLVTRTQSKGKSYAVVNRIAIEELEAWFFGDWQAVRAAYPRVAKGIPGQAHYRNPDAIAGGTWEALERVLQKAGYFGAGLRQIEAARLIAGRMDPVRNTSRSFQVLRAALLEIAG
jgi:hypothetical protein